MVVIVSVVVVVVVMVTSNTQRSSLLKGLHLTALPGRANQPSRCTPSCFPSTNQISG